ncbi:hypothetical protein STVA_24810 [Allostella vacuolata]|nr:hypothetical protein STVA_24810 [Stella vacuolata]
MTARFWRLGFVWRLGMIVIGALLLVQVLALGAYHLQRERSPEAGFRAPLAGQVAALARLLDGLDPAGRALALAAFNGAGLMASIQPEPPPPARGARLPRLEATLARRLEADGRAVSARLLRPDRDDGEGAAGLPQLIGEEVRIEVELADRSVLVVEALGDLTVRVMGLPVGLVAGMLGLAVAAFAVFAVVRETRPLAALAARVERFGRMPEPVSLAEKGAPDVRVLIRAFNAMQGRILQLLRGRALVVGAIAHDLRTYLTRLRLRAEAIDDPAQRRAALSDLEDMEALLEDSLVFARATFAEGEAGTTDLGRVLARECEERAAMGEVVTATLPPAPAAVRGSPPALRRVVANLLDNAVKYGGRADAALAVAAGWVELTVDDAGPGIAEADRLRVFDPFARLDPSRNRELGGAGLGLTIAAHVVESLGGTIAVEASPAGGARLRVRLPAA